MKIKEEIIDTRVTKYLIFKKTHRTGKKTYNIYVSNKYDEYLGEIFWRSGWRTYVFQPVSGYVDFDKKCLTAIVDYINKLLEERNG